jgi:hypothetical protein
MPCFQKPLGVGCGPHRRCRSDGGQAPSTTPPLPAPGPGPHHITANKPRATRKKSPSRSRPPPAPPFPFPPPSSSSLLGGAARSGGGALPPPLAEGRSGGGCSAPRKVRGAGLRLAPAVGAGDPASGDAAGPAEQGVAAASSFFVLARKFRRFLANVSKTHRERERETVAARC